MHLARCLCLQRSQIRFGGLQLQLEVPNVACNVHPAQGQFLVLLRQIVTHFLHVIDEQHLVFTANASVGFQIRPLLIQGVQQGQFQIQGKSTCVHLFGQPSHIVGNVRGCSHLVDGHKRDASRQFNLRVRHIHILGKPLQKNPL